jgi:hypothetical protein
MLIRTRKLLILFFLGTFLFNSCRREFQRPELENEILTPILTTKLSIREIVPDSLREEQANGAIVLIYRNPLYIASLSSFQELETREFEETARLQSLVLSPRSAIRTVSLGQVVEGAGLSAFIQHGSNQIIPPFNGLSYGPLAVDGTAFFETVTLDSGFMDVNITNQLPTGLQQIDFEIRNASNNSLVGQENFANVPAGETRTRTINLAGKTVEGDLLGSITNFNVTGTGSSPVLIDTNDQIILTLTVRDMQVNAATAIFPAQEVVSLKDTTAMENVLDLRITKATAKTGFVDLRVISTLDDTIYFNYYIPEGKKDGVPLERNIKIAPNPNGLASEDTFNLRVDGYTFDLTGAPIVNHYNAFYSELTGRIDSTGEVVSLSLQDSIRVFVKLRNFVPEYVEGYLGNTEVSIGPQSVPLDLFKSFYGGTLDLEEVEVDLTIENGNGVPFDIALNSLNAINTRTGKTTAIDLSALPSPLAIEAAQGLNTPFIQQWMLDDNSSNVNEALNTFPNKMEVAMQIISNPDQNTADLSQFAVDTNTISAFADIRVPLSLIAKDLLIADTILLEPGIVRAPEQIESGIFYIILENSFPFSGSITLNFLDNRGRIIYSIQPNEPISAGSRGQSVQSVLESNFTQQDLMEIISAESVTIAVELNTEASGGYQQIYSDQAMEATLSARFKYLHSNED